MAILLNEYTMMCNVVVVDAAVVDISNGSQPSAQPEADVFEPPLPEVADNKPDSDSSSTKFTDKMATGNSDQPASPPIAVTKGSYAINWDDFDEYSDPSMIKKAMPSFPQKLLPGCNGAGDAKFADDVDPFKPSRRRVTNSPMPAVVPASDGPTEKRQSQRLSINNNLPEEPVTEGTVSSASEIPSKLDAEADSNVSEVTENPVINSADDADGFESATSEGSDVTE